MLSQTFDKGYSQTQTFTKQSFQQIGELWVQVLRKVQWIKHNLQNHISLHQHENIGHLGHDKMESSMESITSFLIDAKFS